MSRTGSNVGVTVEEIGRQVIKSDQLIDGKLTGEELGYMINLNCSTLKAMFNTNKDICIYLVDADGNLIENGSHVIHGIGCPGINISGLVCGSYNATG